MPLAKQPATPTPRQNLKDDFFVTVKFLVRYTKRMERILDDRKRWLRHRLELAEAWDSDLERLQILIVRIRDDFAAARAAAAEGVTDEQPHEEPAPHAGEPSEGQDRARPW